MEEQSAASSVGIIHLSGMEEFRKEQAIQLSLVNLMDSTGYDLIQENGQRRYGGPPPNWEGPAPRIDCEVFVGKIPTDMYEDELVPLFARAGTIYEMRLMMQFNGQNRGYAFVMYTDREAARKAVQMLNNYEVRRGKFIGVSRSLNKCSLFLGCIPKDKSKGEIMEKVNEVTEGLLDVTVLPSYTSKNQGYAFLEYETHKAAAFARKALMARVRLWGKQIWVNWAKWDQNRKGANQDSIKAVQVRNLLPSTTVETLQCEFERFKPDAVARVRKFTHHAFVHFSCHRDAVDAARAMNGTNIDGNAVVVTLDTYEGASRKSGWKGGRQSKAQKGGATGVVNRQHAGTDESYAVESMNPHVQWSSRTPGAPLLRDQGVFSLGRGCQLFRGKLQLLRPNQFGSAVSRLELYCCVNNLLPPCYELFFVLAPEGGFLLVYKVTGEPEPIPASGERRTSPRVGRQSAAGQTSTPSLSGNRSHAPKSDVVMPLTQEVFIPDKACVQVDVAKELAAEYVLWSIGNMHTHMDC
ncbi:probable RNA-binding protein 46 isoform X2 [Syngnathoides biaculeatus]|nr:probable RNA-binding protein 46 isoform X2 [Syngnathoides biaculeatus]